MINLKVCRNYSGIREENTEAEEAVINDLISTEFKSLSPAEIGQAFKMNASGKYWDQVQAYQFFNPSYVGKVLNQYKEWKRKEQMKPKPIEPSKQIEAPKVNEAEERRKAFEKCKEVYAKNREWPITLPLSWNLAFQFLEETGELVYKEGEKDKILYNTIMDLNKKIKEAKVLGRNKTDLEIDLRYIKLTVRRREVKKYIESLYVQK